MSTSLQDWMVQCPFYANDERGCIRCEGPIDSTRLKISFVNPTGATSQERKLDYLHKYCCREFKSCRVYQMNEAKYE